MALQVVVVVVVVVRSKMILLAKFFATDQKQLVIETRFDFDSCLTCTETFCFDDSRCCFCARKCLSLISLKDDFWLQNFNNLDQVKRGSAVVVHFCRLQCSLPHYKPPLNRILLQCLRSPSLSLSLSLPLLSLSPIFLTRMHSLDHRGQSG